MNMERPRKTTAALRRVQAKNSEILIFISHSSKDRKLAERLFDFLRVALDLSSEAIRCTSVDESQLPAGALTDQQLKREIHSARVFIGLITPNSLKSAYVLSELGARWGAKRYLVPVVAGIAVDALPNPLRGINAIAGNNETQLLQLVKDVGEFLHLDLPHANSYIQHLKKFARFAEHVQSGDARTSKNAQLKRKQWKVALPEKFDARLYKIFCESLARTSVARKRKLRDIRIEKLIVLHYLRINMQIGFRVYKGLSARNDSGGSLPLYVYTSSGGPPDSVDFFHWNNRSQVPKIGRAVAQVNHRPAIALNALNGSRNLSIFKHYPDPDWRPDFFHLNPFPVSDAYLNHYVVVHNKDLAVWNPNKFLLEVTDDKTGMVQISKAAYQTLLPANPALENARELLSEAEEILVKFFAIPDATSFKSSDSADNFHNVRTNLRNIFHENSFDSDEVTVFWLERKASETNLYLAYVFQH